MKKYPKYKKSGIAWLGEIPEGWKVVKLTGACDFVRGNSSFKKDELLSNGKYVALQYGKTYKVDEVDEAYKFYVNDEFYKNSQIVNYGDVIFISTSETIEDLGHSVFYNRSDMGLLGGEQMLLKPKKYIVNEKYLYYSSKVFSKELQKYGTGVKVYRFNKTDLKTIYTSIPKKPEQTAIANFLDYKLEKIDRFITKKKQLIELLKEQKAAIINHAVTKGVNPNSIMKPSGVEWLGDIPEGWEVRKLKYVADCFPSNIDKHSKENEEAVRLCNYTDVYKNDFIKNEMDLMVATAKKEQIKKFSLLKNDVIITKDSETADDIANPALVIENLENVVCGYHLSVLRPYEKLNGGYLFRALQCKPINVQFELCSLGVTRVGLGVYDMKSAKIPLPPISEQKEIFNFIQAETKKIEKTISTIAKEIALVEEYKTALIAEAVTGKIDVREFEVPQVETPLSMVAEEATIYKKR